MILYYIRHGDPIYSPDSLTDTGVRQAEALSRRLKVKGLDEIYCSTSNRAIMTAKPTCELLNIEAKSLDFANESFMWRDFTIKDEKNNDIWLFQSPKIIELFNTKEIRDLGDSWYDHPVFTNYKKGIKRVYDETDKFLEGLGYEHIRHTGKYKIKEANDKKVALFAHQGFGLAFLSCLLDIPYPMFCTHFDICHSGFTVIDFNEINGISVPKILVHSSEAHIYHENLPIKGDNYLKY